MASKIRFFIMEDSMGSIYILKGDWSLKSFRLNSRGRGCGDTIEEAKAQAIDFLRQKKTSIDSNISSLEDLAIE